MSSIRKIWKNETAFILGGGTSIIEQFGIPAAVVEGIRNKSLTMSAYSDYMKVLWNRNVIGINAAYLIGDWIDFVFFHDEEFWQAHKQELEKHPGTLVTCNSRFQNRPHPKVMYIPKDRSKLYGIHNDSNFISWNHNSGAAAMTLASHLGVNRIVLLGFDMNAPQGVSHFHSEYNQKRLPPFAKHLVGFKQIAEDAKQMGIEIINCSMESAIDIFPKRNLMEVIND